MSETYVVFLKATLILLGAAGVRLALHRRSAAARHAATALAVAALLVLPALARLVPRVEVRVLENAPPAVALVAWIWAAGTAFALGRLLLGLVLAFRTVQRARPVDDIWSSLLHEAASTIGVGRKVRVLESDGVAVPIVWSAWRPTVLVPPEAHAWPNDRKRALLMHELAHVARHDWLVQLLAGIIRALYWPHPLAWWAMRRLRRDAERASDDRVVAAGVPAADLADHLLAVARALHDGSPRPLSAATAAADRSNLHERVLALLDAQTPRRAPTSRALKASGLAAFAALSVLASLQPVGAVADVLSTAASVLGQSPLAFNLDLPPSPAPKPAPITIAPPKTRRPAPGPAASPAAPDAVSVAPPVGGPDGAPASLPAAAPAPAPARVIAPPPLVVRIGVDLVQLDAVVTDGGRHVTDLAAADFEVRQDGRAQRIVSVQYVNTASAPTRGDSRAPLKPENVRRSIVLVVNDLMIAFEHYPRLRESLHRFVDEQMGEGDLVAVLRIGSDLGLLQQFTTDKRVLHAAIDEARYRLRDRWPGVTDFNPGRPDFGRARILSGPSLRPFYTRYEEEHRITQTTFALRTIVEGLRYLPGRKSVVFLSGSMILRARPGEPNDWALHEQSLQDVADAANRSSVVVYGIDPRGVHSNMVAMRVLGTTAIVAEGSGGEVFSSNDITASLNSVLEDQQGYYLIGYEPEAASFGGDKRRADFHKLQVRVKRPGLRVRSRRGFIGVPDEVAVPDREGSDPLVAAAVSPFPRTALPIRLTSLYGRDDKEGYVVRSLVHVDGGAIGFVPADHGAQSARFELKALVVDGNGFTRGELLREVAVPVPGDGIEAARRTGVVLQFDVPLKEAGAYQVRAVVRDTASGRIGSAAAFVPVPNLKERRLAISDIAVQAAGVTASGPPDNSAVLRRFAPGDKVSYGFAVYNATRDGGSRREPLRYAWRLLRNGEPVVDGTNEDITPGATTATRGVVVAGTLEIPRQLASGEYQLEATVIDPLATASRRSATRQVALQIVD